MRQGQVQTDDGARLHYQSFGDPRGPAIVFANGIGVDYPGASLQMRAFSERHHFICWSYRGVGESRVPGDQRDGDEREGDERDASGLNGVDLSMGRHAEDALTVLDHLGVERAVFIGWSMGVQVTLEVARRAPARLAGFVALLGAYGRPFRTAFPLPLAVAAEALFRFAERNPKVAQAPLDLATALPSVAFRVLGAAVFVGRDADREIFARNVASVARMDRRIYLRTMLELAAHDAEDVLPSVTCPTLIIAATRDHLTPPSVAREMVAKIPTAEYREVEGGTHFALIEVPGQINGWIGELLERVYGSNEQRQ